MNSPMPPSLAALFGGPSTTEAPRDRRGLPEAQMARLRDVLERYRAPNPFQVGDFVTPRAEAGIYGAGTPHIVLERLDRGEPSFTGVDTAGCRHGMRYDMRVACITATGVVGAWWQESYEFELWTPPAALVDVPTTSPPRLDSAEPGPWSTAGGT